MLNAWPICCSSIFPCQLMHPHLVPPPVLLRPLPAPAVVQAWEDLKSGSGYSSEAGMQLADMSNYLLTKGLGHLPKPMWWLNGLLSEVPEGGHNSVDSAVGFAIMQVCVCVCVGGSEWEGIRWVGKRRNPRHMCRAALRGARRENASGPGICAAPPSQLLQGPKSGGSSHQDTAPVCVC